VGIGRVWQIDERRTTAQAARILLELDVGTGAAAAAKCFGR
jgi:hypothetical protein